MPLVTSETVSSKHWTRHMTHLPETCCENGNNTVFEIGGTKAVSLQNNHNHESKQVPGTVSYRGIHAYVQIVYFDLSYVQQKGTSVNCTEFASNAPGVGINSQYVQISTMRSLVLKS